MPLVSRKSFKFTLFNLLKTGILGTEFDCTIVYMLNDILSKNFGVDILKFEVRYTINRDNGVDGRPEIVRSTT